MRIYLYVGIVIAVLAGIGWYSVTLYNAGKDAVVSKLQDDKIQVLKDGKSVDENVLASDDDGLLCLLLDNCPSDRPL